MRVQKNLQFGEGDQSCSATFDKSQVYRYLLLRQWKRSTYHNRASRILWIMLNPSTADERQDDPTIRRCISFSKLWGFDALTICNIFALRATNPNELYLHEDPVGPNNDTHIGIAIHGSDEIIVAWGAHHMAVERSKAIIEMLEQAGRTAYCLGTTKSGAPRHPLYVRRDTERIIYEP